MTPLVLFPAVSVSNPVMSPVPSATTTCNSSPEPLELSVAYCDVPGGPVNKSAYFHLLLIFELSGIAVCKPAPHGSSFKRIVNAFVDVLIAVT